MLPERVLAAAEKAEYMTKDNNRYVSAALLNTASMFMVI